MMKEVEAKILEVDKQALAAQLESMGAKKTFDGLLTNHIYKKEGFPGYYRIREDGTRVIVTLKTKNDDKKSKKTKSLDEREKIVESKEEAEQDAKKLGFLYETTNAKERVEYAIAEAHFAIDTYEEIPSLLEIEAPSELQVIAWAEKLGYTEEDLKPWGYNKLKEHYEG